MKKGLKDKTSQSVYLTTTKQLSNEKNTNSITEQLNEIRKTSIARIICDNTKIQQIQPMAFRQLDDEVNFLVACENRFFKYNFRLQIQAILPKCMPYEA